MQTNATTMRQQCDNKAAKMLTIRLTMRNNTNKCIICCDLFVFVLHLFAFVGMFFAFVCIVWIFFRLFIICSHLFAFACICLHVLHFCRICFHLLSFVSTFFAFVSICLHLFAFVCICFSIFVCTGITPWAPRERAAARERPSNMPPPATTIMSWPESGDLRPRQASTQSGIKMDVATSPV